MIKTLLICHEGAALDQVGLARWLASFSHLAGMVVLRQTNRQMWRRIRREIRRVGIVRFFDVLAFRTYYRLFLSRRDRSWEGQKVKELTRLYPELRKGLPVLLTHSPNTPEGEHFIRHAAPDIVIARCKVLLKERIFSLPRRGTFVLHPGICPDYRNAHGCFWALANGDLNKVGMTLLKIDRGVDTGPVYAYYSYPYDEVNETHIIVQHRVVFENLDALREKLLDIYHCRALPLNTSGRPSTRWGQPWLTRYLHWKNEARKRARNSR